MLQFGKDFETFRTQWVLRVCRFSVNNMSEFCSDPYASHVLRSAFQCLSGKRLPGDALRSRRFQAQQEGEKDKLMRRETEVGQEHREVLRNAAERVCEMEDKKGKGE